MRAENRQGIRYVGLDMSPRFVELCQAKFPGTEFLCGDVLQGDLEISEVDYAILNGVFTEKRSMPFDEMWDYCRAVLRQLFPRVRYGLASIPMDEALVSSTVDLSGRPFLVFSVPVTRARVSNFDLDLLQEFFRAFAFNAEMTLHVTMHYGHNLHHITEAVFKAVGRALAEATRLNPRIAGLLPSTKGTL